MVHSYDQARLKRRVNAWQDGRCAGVECRDATGWLPPRTGTATPVAPAAQQSVQHLLQRPTPPHRRQPLKIKKIR
ncbi:hypothetical protein [Azospirillum largimobile]